MSGAPTNRNPSLPDCGKCGYPVIDLERFECPECGSDLREVGLLRPGASSGINDKIILSTVYTVLLIMASTFVWNHAEAMLPYTVRNNARIKLRPNTNNYDALIRIETEQTVWGGQARHGAMEFRTASQPYPTTTPLQVDFMGQSPAMKTSAITLQLRSSFNRPKLGPHQPLLSIDPVTRHIQWLDSYNKSHQTQAPATANEFLDFLASVGADPSNSNTISEANQLYQFLDGLAHNQTQFTLAGFSSFGGGGGSGSSGPSHWYQKGCVLLIAALWVGGMVRIVRLNRREVFKPGD